MIQKIEKFLQDLITGKIPTTLDLHEPDSYEEGETFKEDVDIELPDDCSIHCEFEWSYSRKEGQKGDGYLTADDPDTLTLNWLNITEFSYFETEITPLDLGPMFEEPKLKGLMLQFLSNEIVGTYCDEMSKSIYQEIKSLRDKGETTIMAQTKENRLMKFENFVNESKKEETYSKKDVYKKGDYIAYKIYFPPSGMMADSKGEYSKTIQKGTIKKRTKHWAGGFEYTLSDGSTIKGTGGILGLVD